MWKPLLILLGFIFVGLAALGVVLPGLPTTPFLLVAAACFAKSSTRFYNWLITNKVFGPVILDWRQNRTMPARAKMVAITSILFVGSFSLITIPEVWLKIVVGVLLLVPLFIVLRIRVTPENRQKPSGP